MASRGSSVHADKDSFTYEPKLSARADNVGVFQTNWVYQRETHFIHR